MRRPILTAIAAACLAGMALPAGAFAASATSAKYAARTFDVTYRAVVRDLPSGAGRVEVWIPYPQSDAHQTIHSVRVEAAAPVEIAREPEHGNAAIHLVFERPAAGEIPIAVSFTATRREYVRPLTRARQSAGRPRDLDRFLAPERLVPTDGRIREMALEVTKGKRTDVEKARAIYDHVTKSVKYDKSGEGWGRGDALWVCDARRGNCTDFHSLIIGMARAVGIPAKFAIGFPLPAARGEGEIGGYHCWAELYVNGVGWIPVDSSEASKNPAKMDYFFGAHDENRVQLSVGRDLLLAPRQKGEPLNFFVYPYVEVDGRPHTAVERQFAFRYRPPPALSRGYPASESAQR
jgi:transglutaminase-like putative cysteine protease